MSESLPLHLAHFERYSLPEAERDLSEKLNLAWDPQMQDWDLVNANESLLPKLTDLVLDSGLSDSQSFSAMCLAVASYDEALQVGAADSNVWSFLREELVARAELYASIVWYWSLPAIRGGEAFPLSAAMAEVWGTVEKKLAAVVVAVRSPSIEGTDSSCA
jgi:hypothetical protein